MSTWKAKTFVLSLAIVPPVLVILDHAYGYQQLLNMPRVMSILAIGLYMLAVMKITVPFFTSPLRRLPYPPGGAFLLGHMNSILFVPSTKRADVFRDWIDNVPSAGLLHFRGPFQTLPGVLVTTMEGLHELLLTKPYDFKKSYLDGVVLSYVLGHGLITSEGAEHKFQRKSITPAFSGSHIHALVPLFWSKAREFTNVIADQLSIPATEQTSNTENVRKLRTGILELNQWASRVTLDIIGVACVGRDFDSLHNAGDELAHQYESLFNVDRLTRPATLLLGCLLPQRIARWLPIRRVRETTVNRQRLRSLCQGLMETKRRDMEIQSEKHVDILSVLIRTGQFSDIGLVDQLLTFLAAGHETTANALTWTIWLLAVNPSSQKTLRAELRDHFAEHGPDTLTHSLLESLPYLNAVTSEQLRLYPVVPLEARVAACDTAILGQVIPRGTIVHFSPWATNRSRTIWGPDAAEFRPERWLIKGQERWGGGKGALSLLTFLHGPRSCIGQAFARAELKCLVAAFVMSFEFEMADPTEKIEPAGLITIKPENGLRLRLKEL
nr:cytochrome p450 94a1 [Quercus suber]